MEYLFLKNGTEEETERKIYNPPTSHSEVVLEVIRSLPIHFKLILYACLRYIARKRRMRGSSYVMFSLNIRD